MEKKPYDFKNSPNHAQRNCRIVHIENLTSNKRNSGFKRLLNKVLISKLLHTFLKYKKWGQWWKFRDINQYIQTLVGKQGWFYSDFKNFINMQLFMLIYDV